jgi:hypothetical protein
MADSLPGVTALRRPPALAASATCGGQLIGGDARIELHLRDANTFAATLGDDRNGENRERNDREMARSHVHFLLRCTHNKG